MRAHVRQWIIVAMLLGGVSSTLEQTDASVTTPPPPIVFPAWHEGGQPEDSVEYDVEFPSAIESPYPENNVVPVRVLLPSERSGPIPVVLVLHYWGATDLRAELSFASELNRRGIGAAIMALPYHLGRTPRGHRSGEMAVEPDPAKLKTVMLQATLDARRTIDFLSSRPEFRSDQIGLFGTSLGAVVAALVYAVEPRITQVSYVVGGIDLAGILWGSSRVVPQRDALRRKGYTEPKLRAELAPIEPGNYLPRATPTPALVIAGRYDTVVPTASTLALIAKLDHPQTLWLDTGHYGGIFVQRRLLREVAQFFDMQFSGKTYVAPKKLVAPTVRIGVKYDIHLGPDLGLGLDLIQFDGRGDAFLTAFATPSSVQLVLARRLAQGFSLDLSLATRGVGVGLFWSSVL